MRSAGNCVGHFHGPARGKFCFDSGSARADGEIEYFLPVSADFPTEGKKKKEGRNKFCMRKCQRLKKKKNSLFFFLKHYSYSFLIKVKSDFCI